MKRFLTGLTVLLVSVLMALPAMATRGTGPHAYGTRATGLGGAFDAISDDAISPAVYNPAGLTQIKNKRFDMDMIFLRTFQHFKNKDTNPQNGQNGRATSAGFIPEDNLLLNNDADARTAKNNYFIMGGMGYAMRLSPKMVFGAGFVGRAGGGVFYKMKQSPFSFILPYDANGTTKGPPDDVGTADDFLVPLATTRRGVIVGTGVANSSFSSSQLGTKPSDKAYFVSTEYSTDLKIPELGPAIGYAVNDYLSLGVNARIVAGAFRFKQAVGTDSTIMKGTGMASDGSYLGGGATRTDAKTLNFGQVLRGTPDQTTLGGVQFGYAEIQGVGRLENAYAAGLGWGTGFQYRPYGSNKLVLSASYKSRAIMNFKGGELMMDFSDQFRKFYYDIGQFGEFKDGTFGASYLSNGAQTLRSPKFFNALLGMIDKAATSDPDPAWRTLAQQAMEWFFNGTNKDGTPTLVRDANGYIRSIDLTAYYDPYIKFAMPRELAFGGAWRPTEKLLLSLEYHLIYMDDMVGDNFTINLRSGSSPFFDYLLGVQRGGGFDFSMYTDFNTIRSIALGAEYDLGNKWTIRGGVQHSNNTFTANHIPITFNMQPEDEISLGGGYRLNEHWALDCAGSFGFTWDTTESKGTEKTGGNGFIDTNGDGFYDRFQKGSQIDQFHSNAEFDHKQWQVNFGVAYLW